MTSDGADVRSRPGPLGLAFAVLGAPAAWGVHLGLSYLIVPESCQAGTRAWMHAVTLVTAVVAAGAVLAAGRLLHRAREGGDPGGVFLGGLGLTVGVLFTAVVLVEGIPVLLVDPCR